MNESAAQVRYGKHLKICFSLFPKYICYLHFNVEVKMNNEILPKMSICLICCCFYRDITRFKPLSSRTSMSVIIGDSFDQQLPEHLNQVRIFTIAAQLSDASLTLLQWQNSSVVSGIKPRVNDLFPAPDGSEASKEVSGGVLPISQSNSHKRSRPANDLQEAICHQPAPEKASPPTTSQTANDPWATCK